MNNYSGINSTSYTNIQTIYQIQSKFIIFRLMMKHVIEQLFKNSMKPFCPYCHKEFSPTNLPTMMCSDQHLCCIQCYDKKVKVNKGRKCPQKKCQKRTSTHFKGQPLVVFRKLFQFYKQILDITQIQEKHSLTNIQINGNTKLTAQSMFYKAEDLLLMGKIEQSISICKQVIKLKPVGWSKFKIIAHPINLMLCNDAAHIEYYKKHKQTEKERSVYDLLNLCLSLRNQYKRDEKWLLDELFKKFVSIQLFMGLGILYYSNKKITQSKYFLKKAYEINNDANMSYQQMTAYQILFNGKRPGISNQVYNYHIGRQKNYQRPQTYHQTLMILQQQISYIQADLTHFWIRNQYIEVKQYISSEKQDSEEFSQLQRQRQQRQRWYQTNPQYYLKHCQTQITCYQLESLEQKLKQHVNYYPLYYVTARYYIFKEQFTKAINNLEIYLKYVKPTSINAFKTKFYLAYAYSMLPIFKKQHLKLASRYLTQYTKQVQKKSQKSSYEVLWIKAKISKEQKNINQAFKMIQLYQSQYSPHIKNQKEGKQQQISYSWSFTLGKFMNSNQLRSHRPSKQTFSQKCWLLKAQLYELENNIERAIENYQKYLKVFKNDIIVKQKFINILLRSSDIQRALSVVNKQRVRYSPDILYRLGTIYRQRKNDQKSIQCFLICLDNDKKYASDVPLLTYVSQTLLSFAKFDEALNWAQKLQALEPKNPKALRLLGKIYSSMAQQNEEKEDDDEEEDNEHEKEDDDEEEDMGRPRKIIHRSYRKYSLQKISDSEGKSSESLEDQSDS